MSWNIATGTYRHEIYLLDSVWQSVCHSLRNVVMCYVLSIARAVGYRYLIIELTIGWEGGIGEVGIRWRRVGQEGVWSDYSLFEPAPFFTNVIQQCFICRPLDSTLSEDTGIETRTVASLATLALTARRSNHSARSKPQQDCMRAVEFRCLSQLGLFAGFSLHLYH